MKINDLVVMRYTKRRTSNDKFDLEESTSYVTGILEDIVVSEVKGTRYHIAGTRINGDDIIDYIVLLGEGVEYYD